MTPPACIHSDPDCGKARSAECGPVPAGERGADPVGAALALLNRLPALSPGFVTRMRELADDNINVVSMAAGIEADPVLMLRLLRVANSPFFGMSRRVDSVQDAITVLGLMNARALLIAGRAMESLQPDPSAGFDVERFWEHSLACAAASECLALRRGLPVARAFLGGIVHDIGELAIALLWPDRYRVVSEARREGAIDKLSIEHHYYGFDHAELGARLVEHWRFPPDVCRAVAGHHGTRQWDDANAPGMLQLVDVLRFGNAYANWMWRQGGIDGIAGHDLPDDLARLADEDVSSLAPRIERRLRALLAMMGK
ncbi:HDOD domain-containing protein [Derxia gummosa]|uniref:HDOD domain-containing protein n=1 Tax=Derxia gummosa DSM 723 TaxID=1121388 RepID=A0A8B6X6B1_9BURK|nr:HDOD domain-containing protein [Derxia gummosa]